MSRRRARILDLVKRYLLAWYALTVGLYALAIPFTVFVFPATTLLLTIFVLFGGFTSSLAALASALISADEAQRSADPRT